jgi:type II secretory ATPase GspE/PulE/Tfp pilus assembly ATPase PilB-like protein
MARAIGLALAAALVAAAVAWAQAADKPAGQPAAPAAGEAKQAEAPAVSPEPAQPPVARRLYLKPAWLIVLVVVSLLWVMILEAISEDAGRTQTGQPTWNAVIMIAGLAGLALSVLVTPAFSAVGLVGVLVCGSVYVNRRNLMVAPEQRVMTQGHLAALFNRVLGKVGVTLPAPGARGRRQDMTEIQLLRKDGRSLETISEDARTVVERSEAAVAVKEIVESAVLSRATDIHIEPKQNELQVRFRIDGILHNVPSYPPHLGPPMITVLKVLSDMDIAERRKPQDGSFMGRLGAKTLDFRAATSASVYGETMVIRILDRDAGLIGLDRLGLDSKRLAHLKRLINSPYGMLVVSGPTGSGKSTTLYAALSEIDAYQKNIITIENPIEYRLENVTQTQVNTKAGITFAGQLRSMLRQDPNVIMVGEVRDAETARVALQAAMTGHFVFTTIHANDAISTLFRLLDLGVEPYLISSSLTAVLAQRLVRVLCERCKLPYVPKPAFIQKAGLDPRRVQQFFKAVGCEACQMTGYYGRVGVFELLEVNDAMRDQIRTSPNTQAVKAEARKAGLVTLQEDGLNKVVQGVTSMKELIRVTK